MSGKGLEQVPHISRQQPPVDHHHLSDGIHGPAKHTGQTKSTSDAGGATTRGQTEGGRTGSGTKPTGGSGGQTEGGGGTTEGGGGTTEGGGGGPKQSRQFAPTAQRHNFHVGTYEPEQTVITVPGTPPSQSTIRTTTTESTKTTTTQHVDSTVHTHSGFLKATQSEHHDMKIASGEKSKHVSHEVPAVHHHSHHHLIHHHHLHRDLTHHHVGEHKHPAYHTHHPIHHLIHHVIKHHIDKATHPHKEETKVKVEPGHVVTHDKKVKATEAVANDKKQATVVFQDQSSTVHKETTVQKVDGKTVVTDSTKVITTPGTPATTIPGPIKEHFQPSNNVQIETNNQGTQSVTVSRTITPRDNLSVRADFDQFKFGTLSITDDHALFPTTTKDGQPVSSNLYLQGGAFVGGKQTTSEGLLPFDQKSGIILGLNGFKGLGHDRSLYGGINYSTGEGFADAGLQQGFHSGYVYGGLQYSVAKGFTPSKSFEFGGSLNLGHGKNSPSLFLEGTAPLDLKSQKPTVWTGLRFSF